MKRLRERFSEWWEPEIETREDLERFIMEYLGYKLETGVDGKHYWHQEGSVVPAAWIFTDDGTEWLKRMVAERYGWSVRTRPFKDKQTLALVYANQGAIMPGCEEADTEPDAVALAVAKAMVSREWGYDYDMFYD